jgi:hypothetical protein
MQSLQPFEPCLNVRGIQLAAEAIWTGGVLSLRYALENPAGALRLPAATATPGRRHNLWESTCFEAFIGRPGERGYRELNLAPNGDWNVYALTDYRENLQEWSAIEGLRYALRRTSAQLELTCALDLRSWIAADQALELSLTAVLDHGDTGCSYWAWQHQGAQADFHLRQSFQRQESSGA